MMELKVQCDCGQRFKFDVEPVNNRMPFPVNCPVCGADGTEKANEILRQRAPAPAAPAFVARPAAPVAMAVPVATPVAAPVAAPPPGLRLNRAAPAANVADNAPVAAPPARPATALPRLQPPSAAPGAPGSRKPSFALGLLGALVGTLVGSLVYFLIFNFTGLRLKPLAIGVGYLAGFGADFLSRKEGSKELGMIAAVLALAGIVGAQYLVARNWWGAGEDAKPGQSAYETSVAEARKVMAAMPNESDQEIRVYLAKENADEGEKPDPKSVTDDEIKEFRQSTLPEMRDLAGGKITKEEFEKKNQADAAQTKEEQVIEERTFKAVFLLLLLSKVNLVSMCIAAGLAYKVCANA